MAGGPAEKIARFESRAIAEPSGIAASRKYPGIFWVHNDSGNPAALFAVRADGKLVREYAVGAPNLDWEDIATDDAGHLYLGDIGNNTRALPIRAIHRIDEPDPAVATKSPLKVTTFHYTYPKGRPFDAEGLFLDGDRAILVAKYLDGRDADLFAVPLDRPTSLLKPVTAEKVGTLKGASHPITGASLAADGKWLAVCGIGEVRLYRRDADGRWLHEAKMKGPPGQVEAITWDGHDLVLANEDREIFRIAEAAWRADVRDKGRKK